uniref:AraC regulator n=1 Tax=Nocardiopsis sp. CMB-M0232 TaxID=1231934 RepID=A0A0D5BTU0_9ACTN|nr:AraC regulator [Nocardiopsis sp. CMB-M0232]
MLDRLNKALEHVEEDPGRPVDVAAMARTALTSEHHLRRMFAALAGMPLSEYVRRRRLTLAGAEVLEGRRTLLDIAVGYGYSSAEAFNRAFRAVHGITPGQARRTGATLVSQSRLAFHLTIEGSTTMRYRILDKDAFSLVGLGTRIPNVAAATTAPTPEGMERLEVPAGTWAVFPFERVEFPRGLQNLWRAVYTEWFPAHPAYRTAPGPALVAVEHEEEPDLGSGHVWLLVDKQAPVPG